MNDKCSLLIRECQNEISKLSPNPYYEVYKKSEGFYWSNIPSWIYEDWKDGAKNCLDIGCAYGTLALYCKKLFDCKICAMDFLDIYLSEDLKNKYEFDFKISNIEVDDFPWNEKFDIIIFTEVLEHFNFFPIPTLKKIKNLLSPKGRVYLSTPDALEWGKVFKYYKSLNDIPMPEKKANFLDDHVYVFDQAELIYIIQEAGFKIQRFDYSKGVEYKHFNLALTA